MTSGGFEAMRRNRDLVEENNALRMFTAQQVKDQAALLDRLMEAHNLIWRLEMALYKAQVVETQELTYDDIL
jgi:hypothetical protein